MKTKSPYLPFVHCLSLLPVRYPYGEQVAETNCERLNPRKRNIESPKATTELAHHNLWRVKAIHYKGQFRGRVGSSYTPTYFSVVRTSDAGRVLYWEFVKDDCLRRVKVPAQRGFRWAVVPLNSRASGVQNGLVYIRLSDGVETHVPMSPASPYCFSQLEQAGRAEIKMYLHKLKTEIETSAKQRKEASKAAKLAQKNDRFYARELPKVRVRLEDSRRAGNCVEGTLSYLERRYKLDRREILGGGHLYSFPALRLDLNDPRVKRSALCAFQRETCISI